MQKTPFQHSVLSTKKIQPTAGTTKLMPLDADGGIYEVLLMFYEQQPDDHYVNHVVARLSGPFSHVEIGFPTYTKHTAPATDSHLHTPVPPAASGRVLFG
eukprot:3939267-Rhodomonas_salina.1